MELIITELGEWMSNLPSILVFTIIMTIIFVVAFKKTFSEKIKNTNFSGLNIFSKSNDHKIKTLKDHDIFNVIDRVRVSLRHVEFYTQGKLDSPKSKMFHDFMELKLDAIETHFKEYLKNVDKNVSMDALKNSLFDLLGNVVDEYLSKAESHFLQKGISPKDTKYVLVLFEKWRAETISSVAYRINSIFASTSHPGKFEKILGCLEVLSMAIDLIPKDGVASFEELNGKFKDLDY